MTEITGYIDVAQVALYTFFAFFVGLVLYLRREDKREGYPLISERSGAVLVQGFPSIPSPKSYPMPEGHTAYLPGNNPEIARGGLVPSAPWPGAPMIPTGNPLVDGVGPAAWATRTDEPEVTWEGEPAIQPLCLVANTFVEPRDVTPIGMAVIAADGRTAGTIREIWTDRSEPQIRYMEMDLADAEAGAGPVLLPMGFARIDARRGFVRVKALLAHQFAEVPRTKSRETITKLEEDKITAYFAGGHLYATPARLGPVL